MLAKYNAATVEHLTKLAKNKNMKINAEIRWWSNEVNAKATNNKRSCKLLCKYKRASTSAVRMRMRSHSRPEVLSIKVAKI